MQTIADYLPEHPFFAGLDPAALELAAGCAVNVHFRPGEFLFHEGDPADTFYVLRHGRVSVQMRTPTSNLVANACSPGRARYAAAMAGTRSRTPPMICPSSSAIRPATSHSNAAVTIDDIVAASSTPVAGDRSWTRTFPLSPRATTLSR